MLRPLPKPNLAQALAAATGEVPDDAVLAAGEGSVSRALALSDGPAFKLRQQAVALLARLPNADPRELHALADGIAGSDPRLLEIVLDAINDWLSERLHALQGDAARAAHVADIWSEVNAAARSTDIYNLDRKPFIFRAFGRLAEAAGG
jgi:DNA polymerase-3 subunit delta'